MSEIVDQIQEATEEAGESKLNSKVAIVVAIAATFMAIFNIKGSNIGQGMAYAQAQAVNSWSYFQSKSTKQNIADHIRNQMEGQLLLASSASPAARAKMKDMIKKSDAEVARYETEKEEIKTKAEGFEQQYRDLGIKDDQFDLAEAVLSLAMAIFGLTALTQKESLFYFGIAMSSVGIIFGLAGFLGWGIHPEWLTSLLG